MTKGPEYHNNPTDVRGEGVSDNTNNGNHLPLPHSRTLVQKPFASSPCSKENTPSSGSSVNSPPIESAGHCQENRMGVVQSVAHSAAQSCSSGMENSKDGAFTAESSEVEDFIHSLGSPSSIPASYSDQTLVDEDPPSLQNDLLQKPFPELNQLRHDSHRSSTGSTNSCASSSGGGRHFTPHRLFKRVRNRLSHAVHLAGNAAGQTAQKVEAFMFPHSPQIGAAARNNNPNRRPNSIATRVRGGVLLLGCHSDEEHRQYTRDVVDKLRPMNGAEGLAMAGLEYRQVPLGGSDDNPACTGETSAGGEGSRGDDDESVHSQPPNVTDGNCSKPIISHTGDESSPSTTAAFFTRLVHIETNTVITNDNRKLFIADGDMYDAVARLCQEAAQDIMIQEGDLEWVTVCDAGANPEPTRALVSKCISTDESTLDAKPTLLIATGKGKVRAGIFSRQHLMTSGVECSTALPIVREAVKREMNIVMVDPNVHGDRLGMIAFEKSMARIFRRWEQPDPSALSSSSDSNRSTPFPVSETPECPELKPHSMLEPPLVNRDLFVLSHSQSGAQLTRYLLDKSEHYLPHIRAVAFTDSTHNIQWFRDNEGLDNLLQSPKSVYYRCSKETPQRYMAKESTMTATTTEPALAALKTMGAEINTDSFWEHRFGKIKTLCAGTTEHSLTNWFARSHIWEHFDFHLEKTVKSRDNNEPLTPQASA
jgi:hypothetical protein